MNESLATIFPVSFGLGRILLLSCHRTIFLPGSPDIQPAVGISFLPELASLELACHRLAMEPVDIPGRGPRIHRQPECAPARDRLTGLPEFLRDRSLAPQPGEALVLYRPTAAAAVVCRTPSGHDLLALKMVEERIDSRDAAREAGSRSAASTISSRCRHPGLPARAPIHPGAGGEFFSGEPTDPDQGRVATLPCSGT